MASSIRGREPPGIRDKDWRTLIYSITQGNCILVLGPEIPVANETPTAAPGEVPLPPQWVQEGSMTLPEMLANQLCLEVEVTNLDSRNLAQVAEFYSRKYGRNDLESEAISFYREAPRSDVFADLARVPFNLVISLTHETSLIDALREQGRSPVVETYDFRGDQKAFIGLGRDGVGTAQQPLVYNLYGHVDTPRSLVLTETDTLDFLSAVISRNPELPSDLRSYLRDNNKSFLLLGFGLTRWYLRILLHILKVTKRDTRSFALERLPTKALDLLQQTILFMKKGLRIESFDFEVAQFVKQLNARLESSGMASWPNGASATGASGNGSPPAPLDAPKIFISYASEDEVQARRIYEELAAAGFDPWLDKQGLRGGDRWDDVIRETLDEVDYVVVLQSTALTGKVFSYVNKEIDLALQRQQFARRGIRYLIPVRIDGSPLLDDLKHLHTIELDGGGGIQELTSTILRDQQRRRKRAA